MPRSTLLTALIAGCDCRSGPPVTLQPERFEVGFDLHYTAAPSVPPGEALARLSTGPRAALGAEVRDVEWSLPHDLAHYAEGLTDQEVAAVVASRERVFAIVFTLPGGRGSLGQLREAEQLVLDVARETHGLVYDHAADSLFAPDAFQRSRIDTWTGGLPDVEQQIVVEMEKRDAFLRLATHGMAKFGLPDLVLADVIESHRGSVVGLLNLAGQTLVEEGTLQPGGKLRIDIDTLRHPGARTRIAGTVLPGATGQATIELGHAASEPGDEDNRMMTIVFPEPEPASEQHDRLLTTLFGAADDEVVTVYPDDPEMVAATRRARDQLPALRAAIQRGLPLGESVLVKAAFTGPDGKVERMWVEVDAWGDGTLAGVLVSEPDSVTHLGSGAAVTLSEAEVLDYYRRFADGREEGDETGKVHDQRAAR